ncbi:transketolase [Keratinibaculum paraultunense]|uniref:Transketolase n=1 Tax=Keratinibaculum paraultunense TaxID=1278232 RepID=A0A4V6NZ68_9FIRM|nr:transketolase family protein [Keratinibaculum paraultunense]QQY80039.1 transketolase family protein [Keratinibaculum paraultunense]TCS91640.1 transketolase [Keratinibaculum paraultunense]
MANMIATREAYGEALKELGGKNKDIVVLDADLSGSTKTAIFAKAYPDRFFNVGIAEQNLMATAAGLATTGKIPFASTFAVFATGRAFEIVRTSICYPKLNVKIAATHAGLTVGEDGATHQALEDLSLMRSLPNMVVLSPADAVEAKQCVYKAVEHIGPVYIRLGRSKVPVIFDEDYKFEIGKGVKLREGEDITLIATGVMVAKALSAAEILAEEGISARVINMSTIKPIDKDIIIKAAKETKGIVTIEEHTIIGGLGSAVSEVVSQESPTYVERIGTMDTFGESGDGESLLEKYGLNEQNIIKKAKKILSK